MDRKTGEVFFGQNAGIPLPPHPELKAALDAFPGPAAAGKGIPGTHSEFNAISQGLFARPGSTLSDLTFYGVRLGGAGQGQRQLVEESLYEYGVCLWKRRFDGSGATVGFDQLDPQGEAAQLLKQLRAEHTSVKRSMPGRRSQ